MVAAEEELQEVSQTTQQDRVALQRLADARLDDFQYDLGAVEHRRPVDLADGGGAERRGADVSEDLVQRPPEMARHQFHELGVRHRGKPVQEFLQFRGDLVRQEILAHAQDLTQFDVGRPEHLQAPAQLHRERLPVDIAADRQSGHGGEGAQEEVAWPAALSGREPSQVSGKSAQ